MSYYFFMESRMARPGKLAVIVGHNFRAQGAVGTGPLEGVTEYKFNSNVAKIMSSLGAKYGLEVGVFMRDAELGYSGQIEKAYRQADIWGARLAIELHFNASPNSNAAYTVTLSSGSGQSLEFARRVQEAVCECLRRTGKQDKGIITRSRDDSIAGDFSLVAGQAPAILVEPFFGSSLSDCELVDRIGMTAYAHALLKAAAEMIGELPREKITQSRTVKGQVVAGAGASATGAGEAVERAAPSAAEGLDPVAGTLTDAGTTLQYAASFSPWLIGLGVLLIVAGIGITLYARLDDFNKGRR